MTMIEVRKRIKLSAVVGLLATISVVSLSPLPLTSRRAWLAQSAGSFLVAGHDSDTKDELPNVLRGISLAPLGKPQASDSKTLNLSLEEVAARLTRDLTEGAHKKGGYFITGDISTDIFRDDCVFSDPTNEVKSLSR
jgi:hypothetical protein